MSTTGSSTHPDPSVVPQDPPETKRGDVAAVKPSQSPALSKLPNEVKTTISKVDEILVRLSKYVNRAAFAWCPVKLTR